MSHHDPQQSSRLYQIRSEGSVFFAGHRAGGTQALVGIQGPELVVVEFGPDGDCRGASAQPLGAGDPEAALARWMADSGFMPGAIRVRPFFLADWWVGTADLPEHSQEALEEPEEVEAEFGAERLRVLQEEARAWQERGDFVLYWEDEYYLSRDGEVESS